jgi:hypothetical protein
MSPQDSFDYGERTQESNPDNRFWSVVTRCPPLLATLRSTRNNQDLRCWAVRHCSHQIALSWCQSWCQQPNIVSRTACAYIGEQVNTNGRFNPRDGESQQGRNRAGEVEQGVWTNRPVPAPVSISIGADNGLIVKPWSPLSCHAALHHSFSTVSWRCRVLAQLHELHLDAPDAQVQKFFHSRLRFRGGLVLSPFHRRRAPL